MGGYLEVLRIPHAWRFSAAGAIARFPNAMLSISMTLMIQGIYGKYAIAGIVSAAYTISLAIGAPIVARLIDRNGQRVVGRVLILVGSAALVTLILMTLIQVPPVLLCIPAAVAGVTAFPVVALSRARWGYLLRGRSWLITRAFAWEAVLDDISFVLGPSIGTALATSIHPVAGVCCVVVLLLIGGWLFLAQRASEPPAHPTVIPSESGSPELATQPSNRLVILNPAVAIVCAVLFFAGLIFGSNNLAVVAFCEQHGVKWFAAILLGAGSLASMTGALIYGARQWRSPLWKRFVFLVLGFAFFAALFPLAGSVPVLFAINFCFGAMVSPTFINGNAMIHEIVPSSQLTEGLTWIGTMVNVGSSIGSLVAGALIDHYVAHAGLWVVAAAGIMGAATILIASPALRRLRPKDATVVSQ
jgi:MFS family permease